MLDIKLIRKDPEAAKTALARRGDTSAIDKLLLLDAERRNIITQLEQNRMVKNAYSKKIAEQIREGLLKEAQLPEKEAIQAISQKIEAQEKEVEELNAQLDSLVLTIPNMPHNTVQSGGSSKTNKIVKEYLAIKQFSFNPLPHWEIGEYLKILDFPTATLLSGSNFPLYKGQGAKLERALYSFMLDLHVKEHGYQEISPPYMVKRECMLGTGQLPKMEGDMYLCEEDDLFLVPTAEVPLVNMHRGQTLDERVLPLNYVAYTPCFRREAGSYGKDTRGLIRIHQFDKVEMVKFTRPESSYEALEQMLGQSEEVLKRLGLPYRVLELCAEEISFASSKTYDIEVWAPGIKQWMEVASISNCEDFQARRANIRCKKAAGKGTFFPHTLNGSAVALARTYLAILETYQNADGTVTLPDVLVPYMGGVKVLQ
ncbi:MAG: serine--tRNA ligase [Candidatus Aureabacteria bacterium]|nr:serine--tRNA ligase [Candidatus Auribacterota bacterium]